MRFLFYSILVFSVLSCSLEKNYISPMGGFSFASGYNSFNVQRESEVINYSSELTNIISDFPNLKDKSIDSEVDILKKNIKSYIYALQEYDTESREKALYRVEESYKNIQNLRKNLNKDEDFILNRFLVKVKGNISKLESLNK